MLKIIFGNSIMPYEFWFIIWLIWLISCIFLFFGKYNTIFFAILGGFLFVLMEGYLFSFHKIDHHTALLTYLLFLLPFLLYSQKKAIQKNSLIVDAWALFLMRLSVVSAYFLAGLEKVLIGGFAWLSPEHIQIHLKSHESSLGLWLAKFDIFCTFLGLLGILFELLFILILFFPKLKYSILFFGIGFHLSNYFLLGVGALLHPWILCYVIWLNIEKK
jgi:hypothetical protein